MLGRGICEKYLSRDENLVSRLVFFANTSPIMIYLFNYTKYYLEHWLNKKYPLFVVFRNILIGLFSDIFVLFFTHQYITSYGTDMGIKGHQSSISLATVQTWVLKALARKMRKTNMRYYPKYPSGSWHPILAP